MMNTFPSCIPLPGAPGAPGGGARGRAGAPNGTAGSDCSSHPSTHTSKVAAAAVGAIRPFRQNHSGQNVCFISRERNLLLENQPRTIVEKCLDYSINPPKTLTGRGLGITSEVICRSLYKKFIETCLPAIFLLEKKPNKTEE